MKSLIQAAAATLLAASTVQAQQAVQWRVQDGGNGHWYTVIPRELPWIQARSAAEDMGAHLVTITSSGENSFVGTFAPLVGSSVFGAWAGGYQTNDSCGPACSWTWVTGEAWGYANWWVGEPNDVSGIESALEIFANQPANYWVDAPDSPGYPRRFAVEWSADCNNDGIVDYGQCRNGSLPDYNGNNIPDCCEAGTPCVVGSYPVQWRTAEGGNGHWYRVERFGTQRDWTQAALQAQMAGGHLVCLSSEAENAFVFSLIAGDPTAWNAENGPWIGARRDGGTWSWVNSEAWGFTNWCGGTGEVEHRGQYWTCGGTTPSDLWNDHFGDVGPVSGPLMPVASVIEWSTDCNNDGIVDKGQILRGQLPDTNNNGIPDGCEVPSCIDADIYRDFNVNGADLGILLSQWGPNTPLTESDLNGDGGVDGVDLGILLSFWGPCP